MDFQFEKQATITASFVGLSLFLWLGLNGSVYASPPTYGQLILINSLGLVANGSLGATASNIKVEVKDSFGICSTTPSLAYSGVINVQWNNANAHSASKCTNIVSVDVTALKTTSGFVQYDSIANSVPPANATAPTNFTAPTTPIANIALIVTGNASPAMTNSATSWGSALGVAPVYVTSNGSISVTGVMGGVGMAGIRASKKMLMYGVKPYDE